MSRVIQRLVAERREQELKTGHKPLVAHIGRDLWAALCAESKTGSLPAGAFIELDGCAYEFRDNMPPTAVFFEPHAPGIAVGVEYDSEGKTNGWSAQLEKNHWKPIGPGVWERDGKQRCSTEEAIAIEGREAAARADIKRRMAPFSGETSGPAPYRTEDGVRVPNIDWGKP